MLQLPQGLPWQLSTRFHPGEHSHGKHGKDHQNDDNGKHLQHLGLPHHGSGPLLFNRAEHFELLVHGNRRRRVVFQLEELPGSRISGKCRGASSASRWSDGGSRCDSKTAWQTGSTSAPGRGFWQRLERAPKSKAAGVRLFVSRKRLAMQPGFRACNLQADRSSQTAFRCVDNLKLFESLLQIGDSEALAPPQQDKLRQVFDGRASNLQVRCSH